ncbi:MAG: hypothetical protein CME70_02105 [Halobacteriovorax sp.]|nr:hypothetical protein [Halobacteriovorax sp.]|tara:strand:+ start:32101 stop:33081 length:981 start_codon:yes stop_codon:yes gene_type:complete
MSAFGKLQHLYENKDISEIIVDRFDDVYWEEKGKINEASDLFKDEKEIFKLIESLLASVNRKTDSIKNGFADLRLGDGTRVAITTAPISINGPSLVIRKLPENSVNFKNLKDWEVLNEEGQRICEALMKSGKNVLLAGNAGSGKTTMANILIDAIDSSWRVVTVEKVAELDTKNRKRTLRLETPTACHTELNDLIKKASLMRADTLVINEFLGSEVFEAIKLMREGYSVLGTIAAEGVSDALKKCELFCLMGQLGIGINEIKYHVHSGIDAVIFQERLESGKRVISHIATVDGISDRGEPLLTTLFSYDEAAKEFYTTAEGKKLIS